jgi:hypothetical protein
MPKHPGHKRVQRKAAATQSASLSVAEFSATLRDWGLDDYADVVRQNAMRDGVEKTAIDLRRALLRRLKGH